MCNHLRHVTAQFLIEHLDLSWKEGIAAFGVSGLLGSCETYPCRVPYYNFLVQVPEKLGFLGSRLGCRINGLGLMLMQRLKKDVEFLGEGSTSSGIIRI